MVMIKCTRHLRGNHGVLNLLTSSKYSLSNGPGEVEADQFVQTVVVRQECRESDNFSEISGCILPLL